MLDNITPWETDEDMSAAADHGRSAWKPADLTDEQLAGQRLMLRTLNPEMSRSADVPDLSTMD